MTNAAADIWTIMTAIGTVGAVLIACWQGVGAHWAARRQVKRLLPALNDELMWIAETAESIAREARSCMLQKKSAFEGHVNFAAIPKAFEPTDAAMLSNYEFPVFHGYKDVLRLGPGDLSTEIASAFGTIFRAQNRLKHAISAAQIGSHELRAILSAANQMTAVGRRAFCVVGTLTNQPMPEEWQPSKERRTRG